MLLLVAGAIMPWAVLGVAMVATHGERTADPGVAPVEGGAAATSDGAPPDPASGAGDDGADPTPTTGVAPDEPLPRAAEATVPSDLAAAAVVALRVELSDLSSETGVRTYVDMAAAEHAERTGSLAVVRVRAVVMEGSSSTWDRTATRRFAVPLERVADHWALAGRPWELPTTAGHAVPERSWDAHSVPEGSAEVLTAAGYVGVSNITASEDPTSGLLRLSFEAELPAGRHDVWLARRPGLRVLGATAAATHQSTKETP